MKRIVRAAILVAAFGTPASPGVWASDGGGAPVFVVALDPGHGGADSGAVRETAAGVLLEKTLTLDIARRVRALLAEDDRIVVAMTRDDDDFLLLDARIERARAAGADLLVSLHANAQPTDSELGGASIYSLAQRVAERLDAKTAARRVAVSERVADLFESALKGRTRMERTPRRAANFRVLQGERFPGVLVELGYVTNEIDRIHFQSEGWRQHVAEGLAEAIRTWSVRRRASGPR